MVSGQTVLDRQPAGSAGARIVGACPIVPVRKVDRSVAFYREVLGFDLIDRNREGTFAHVGREGAGVMLLDLSDAQALKATSGYMSAYFWVENLPAYFAAVRPALDRLPQNRVQPLFEKPDGRHEFRVSDPDGFMLFFGEVARG